MKDRKHDRMISTGHFRIGYLDSNGYTRWWRRGIMVYEYRAARKACSAMIKLNKPVLFYRMQGGNIHSLPCTVLTAVITRGVKVGGKLCMRIVTDTSVAFVPLRSFRWTATIIIHGEWRDQ